MPAAIPALQPIVHDLFVLRGANKADAGKELETQKEVVVSMLLRLIQYHQVRGVRGRAVPAGAGADAPWPTVCRSLSAPLCRPGPWGPGDAREGSACCGSVFKAVQPLGEVTCHLAGSHWVIRGSKFVGNPVFQSDQKSVN